MSINKDTAAQAYLDSIDAFNKAVDENYEAQGTFFRLLEDAPELKDAYDRMQETITKLEDAKKAKKSALDSFREIAEGFASSLLYSEGVKPSDIVFHPRVTFKNTLTCLPINHPHIRIQAVNFLLERGWGGAITVDLPGGKQVLGDYKPTVSDWRTQQDTYLPRTAIGGLPVFNLVDAPKPFIDSEPKWVLDLLDKDDN